MDVQPAVDAPLSVSVGAGVDGAETKSTDPFDEIDLGEYFDQYLDPGFKSPALENVEKPSFETFLSSPVTLSDHLHSQLALVALSEQVRDAAEAVIGNLSENGYLMSSAEELAAEGQLAPRGCGRGDSSGAHAGSGRCRRERFARMFAVAD